MADVVHASGRSVDDSRARMVFDLRPSGRIINSAATRAMAGTEVLRSILIAM